MGGGRAIVIGGSIGGLVAAGVLAPHFGEVQLLERDALPDAPALRKGTPQARHVHVLLRGGESAIERVFPGIFDELIADGSERVDTARDARWHYHGGWKLRFPSGIEMVSQTRALLEWRLRRRLRALSNVALVEAEVRGLAVAGERMRGVHIASGGGPLREGQIEADLVVDASGRGSRLPQWLAEVGYAPAEESEVAVDVGYASRLYRRTDEPRDWTALLCHPLFPDKRCGVLLPVEGGRWLLTLVGWFGDHPPGDDAGLLAFAESLATGALHQAVKEAEPLSEIALHRFPSNRRRHYERARLPEGLAVVGDAACSFNPVYAQGMATAACGATLLDACLREGAPSGFTRRYHERLARVTDAPWLLATCEDLRSREARGPRPAWMPLLHWYTERVHRLTWRDRFAARRFLEVMHLERPPSSLFDPRIALRALAS